MGIKYPHKSIKLFSDFKCGLRTVHLGLLRLVMWCFQPALKETIPLYGKPFLWKINGLCKSGVKKWGMSCYELSINADFVEFMNSPNDGANPNGGTDWAAKRASLGYPEPFSVKYWEIGNEPWDFLRVVGKGASDYGADFIDYVDALKAVDPGIEAILACYQITGWNDELFAMPAAIEKADALQLHLYFHNDRFRVSKGYEGQLNALEDLIDVSANTALKIHISEHSPAQFGLPDVGYGGDMPLNDMLAMADAYRAVLLNHHDRVESMHYFLDTNAGHARSALVGPVDPDGTIDDGFYVAPIYYLLAGFRNYFGEEFSDFSMTNPAVNEEGDSLVNVICTVSDDASPMAYVTLINPSFAVRG